MSGAVILDLDLIINSGSFLHKLFDCLKGSTEASLTFTKNNIIYNELINGSSSANEPYPNMFNSFEINPNNVGYYNYSFTTEEYIICFEVSIFKSKIKDTLYKDKIRIYKPKSEDRIYISIEKPDVENTGVSYIEPLFMQNINHYVVASSGRDENNPSWTVHPKNFKTDCAKCATNEKITFVCYPTYMEVQANSSSKNNGHVALYGSRSSPIPVNLSNINFDLGYINSDRNFKVNYVKVNVSTGNNKESLDINVTPNIIKTLSKRTKLSPEPIKFFLEDDHIKIVTTIKDYCIFRTYLRNSIV